MDRIYIVGSSLFEPIFLMINNSNPLAKLTGLTGRTITVSEYNRISEAKRYLCFGKDATSLDLESHKNYFKFKE